MTLWLKMIGTWDNPWPDKKPYDRKKIGFRGRKPTGVHRGDRMILYAVRWKRIFAVADVTSDWKHNDEDGWPYCVDIRWPLNVALPPSDGIDATEVSARPDRSGQTQIAHQIVDEGIRVGRAEITRCIWQGVGANMACCPSVLDTRSIPDMT